MKKAKDTKRREFSNSTRNGGLCVRYPFTCPEATRGALYNGHREIYHESGRESSFISTRFFSWADSKGGSLRVALVTRRLLYSFFFCFFFLKESFHDRHCAFQSATLSLSACLFKRFSFFFLYLSKALAIYQSDY